VISFSTLLLLMLSAPYESASIPKSSGLTSVGALTSFLVALVLAYCVGTAFRWKDETNKRVETERQLNRLRRSTAIASQMHDAVSGKLSRIAILAHNVLPDIEQAEERERWLFVGETAEEALVGVRQIIDRLDSDNEDPLEGIVESDSLVENIRHLADASDIRLHQQGFDGQSVVRGTTSAGLDSASEELLDLIQELYTNIELHSDQTCNTYHFSIIVNADRAIVSQTNGIKRSLSWNEPVSTGKGLKLHRKTLSALGGVLKTSEEQGQWIVYAVLPLRNADHAPATVKRANFRITTS
jgi:glucose-6-phosphate-specific signal transduction histidine kinase